jgi:hypothetical protein
MSDGAYDLFAILGALAAAAVLWLRFRQGRILKRLLASLTDEQIKTLQEQIDKDRRKPEA